MLHILALYLVTATVFLALDAVMLTKVMRPLFETHIGHLLLESPRLGAAALFYLAYVAGVLWFVSVPALREGAPLQALLGGAILGAMAYGTYEFTNLATLRDWSWQMVVVDLTWGAVLTGFSAWVGVVAVRALGLAPA